MTKKEYQVRAVEASKTLTKLLKLEAPRKIVDTQIALVQQFSDASQ